MAVWGGLENSCEKKRSEKQRRKGKIFDSIKNKQYYQINQIKNSLLPNSDLN